MNYPSEFDPADYLPPARPVGVAPPAGMESSAGMVPDAQLARVQPRQPNLLYTLLLVVLWFVWLLLVGIVTVAVGTAAHLLPGIAQMRTHVFPKTSIFIEALAYLLTFATAAPLFAHLWRRPFSRGIQWASEVARAYALRLVALGIALSVIAQLIESHLTLPNKMPMDAFFRTPADVLIVAGFGTLIAPIAEEIFFRGFLLPGVAIAWDWMTLPRTDEARLRWQSTETLSRNGIIAGGVLSSFLFAVLHAAQLGFAWNAVGVLWLVGGALTVVRIRLNSVAASSLVHMAYNGFIFAVLLVATGGLQHLDRLAR